MESEPTMNLDGKIIELLLKAAADIGVIGKDTQNQQQGYKFRGIDAIVDHTAPAFRKHGIVAVPSHRYVTSDLIESSRGTQGRRVIVQTTVKFIAKDGSYITAEAVGEGADYADKATNKAMAQALKYALSQTLLIPTGDADPDAESPETGSGSRPKPRDARGSASQQKSAPRQQPAQRRQTKSQSHPPLVFSPEDRDPETGWWPQICPSCGGAVINKTIPTKNGDSPLFQCDEYKTCRDWPGRERKDGDGYYPWSEFGSDPAKIWGPGGWVDDHIGAPQVTREDYEPAESLAQPPDDYYDQMEAPF